MEHPRDRLRIWRTERTLSREAAGALLGTSGSFLAHIEHGRRWPGRRIANTIERVCGIAATDWDAAEDACAKGDADAA